MAKALTVVAVEKAKAGGQRREIPDGLLPGLYLIVQPSGHKSWAVRSRLGRATKKFTIGPVATVTLTEARQQARDALQAFGKGIDPNLAKRALREVDADLIEIACADFVAQYAKLEYRRQWARETERLLTKEVIPVWRGRSVQSIKRRDIVALIDKIDASGRRHLANSVARVVSKFFAWLLDKDRIDASPAHRIKPKKTPLRDRTLSNDELRALWKAAGDLDYPAGPLWRLWLLSGQRRSDVAGAQWSEIDFEGGSWTIPAARFKNGKPHLVPLTTEMIGILQSLPRFEGDGDHFLFSTRGGQSPVSGFSKMKVAVADAIERDWRIHDLRRTVRTRLSELGIRAEVAEAVIGHTKKGLVARYDLHEFAAEKRHALETWNAALLRIISGQAAPANIVQLRAGT